jgi:hypothetical protein
MIHVEEYVERAMASSKVRACDTDVEAEVERRYQVVVGED